MAKEKKANNAKIAAARDDCLSFDNLVKTLVQTNNQATEQASKAINMGLTLRNWLFGHYIYVYEQGGADRASYGENLLQQLSQRLQALGVSRTDERELRRYRQFYLIYPQIRDSLTPEFSVHFHDSQIPPIRESSTPELPECRRVPSGMELLSKLSFTALAELIQIDDALKRAFYERESIRGGWSVRELRRQIATLLYERTGLSTNKRLVMDRGQEKAEKMMPAMTIRDPYVFEFLGLQPHEALDEGNLESLLLQKIQDFLLELGHGFCFEGRQKRILMGDEYCFVDLVFYHRILKCHVLVELKVDEFSHQHLGQLNTYVQWYKENMMEEGDNPPIGILLCTKKGKARRGVVEYALAGMDNRLFVSRYEVELPKKEDMEKLLMDWAGK